MKRLICEEAAQRCVAAYGPRLRALVLTGSLARDEATPFQTAGVRGLLGDGEFLLVFKDAGSLPPDASLGRLEGEIAAALLRHDVVCSVSLAAVGDQYLRRLRPHIFAYELRVCGQVIWGDGQVLSLIPPFSRTDIPLEDAWRLLCNRMIEQLEAINQVGLGSARPQLHYRTLKLYLDMATSCLVFAGAYEPTYRRRAASLGALADGGAPREAEPFPLADFAARVRACTEAKLGALSGGDGSAAGAAVSMALDEAVAYAERLWRWELCRLTGLDERASNRALIEAWMRRQRMGDRLRGWAYVVRKRGWHRSWRSWLRWGRLARRASPRYWVYACASELFFRLPRLLAQEGSPDLGELARGLPEVHSAAQSGDGPAWRKLASDVAWNYHEFLVGTRA